MGKIKDGDFVKFEDGRDGLMKVLIAGDYCTLLRFDDNRKGFSNYGSNNPQNIITLIPIYHLIRYDDWINLNLINGQWNK